MMKFRVVCTPGYNKKTGYYYRAVRDILTLEKLGAKCKIKVLDSIYLFLKEILHTFKSKEERYLLENIASGSILIPICILLKKDLSTSIMIYHGSLEDLKSFRFYSFKRFIYEKIENILIKNNINVVFVSSNMTNAYKLKYPANEARFFTTPNIPSEKFIAEIYHYENSKKKIDTNKTIITYCGNTQEWQRVDVLIKFAKRLVEKNSNFFFLFLTQEYSYFSELASKNLIDGSYNIQTVNNEDVPLYLMSSDYLYLVRDYNETNLYSCPTKAVEYIYSQKPLIISKGIGDISDYVIKNDLGLVVPYASEIDIDVMVEQFIEFNSRYVKSRFDNSYYPNGFEPDVIFNVFKKIIEEK